MRPDPLYDWTTTSGPFARLDGSRPASIRLRQVGDSAFALEEPFGYDGTIVVDPRCLQHSNLASIPGWLGWFMRRHGRHTAAALMHDQLVNEEGSGDRPTFDERVVADAHFRDALAASGVRPVRVGLMWTAVTLATRRSDPGAFVLLLSWMVTALAGLSVLGWGIVREDPVMIAAALLAPAVASIFWETQWRAGVIAGYSLPIVILGSVPAIVAFHIYWVVDWFYVLGEKDQAKPQTTYNTR